MHLTATNQSNGPSLSAVGAKKDFTLRRFMSQKNKIIHLLDIEQFATESGEYKVIYKLDIDGEKFDLHYIISSQGCNTVQTHIDSVPFLSDPVVVSLMYHLLIGGYDFKSDIPISGRLYHHLTKDLIPHFVSMNPDLVKPITLNVPVSDQKIQKKANFVGTGISCGIDSLCTIKEYLQEETPDYKLTHLLNFKLGAHHGLLHPCPEDIENKNFKDELVIANKFSKEIGFTMIVVDSNINQMANKFWGAIPFGNVAWFRNVGAMLVMQEYFSKYIFATSYATFRDFNLDFTDGLEHNLWWSMPLLGSDYLEVVPANSSMTRIEKTEFISDFEPAYNNLSVCWLGNKNCGECDKCIRTLVALDFIGVLDKFKNVFDVEKYYKNRNRILRHVVLFGKRDAFFRELCKYASVHNIKMPSTVSSVFLDGWQMLKKYGFNNIIRLTKKHLKAIRKR